MKKTLETYQILSKRMVIFTVLLMAFCSLLFYLHNAFGTPAYDAIIDTGSLLLTGTILLQLIGTIQRYYHSHYVFNSPNLSIIIFFTILTLLTNYVAVNFFSVENALQTHHFQLTIIFKSIILLFTFFICLMYCWIEEQKIREARITQFAVDKERESVKIELKSLQQQFKPHFLFNSLNSINALTISNPEEARNMVQLLSDFMRGSVRENQDELTTLKEEIQHIQLYSEIEKVRFGERLSILFDIDKSLHNYMVPALILQPIIENAIKYGLYGSTDVVTLNILASLEKNNLIISISNPFDPSVQSEKKGTGYGLVSIKKKMMILYNQAHLLTTQINENTFITILKIPQL